MFNRRHGDFALVAVAATLAVKNGKVQRLRVALSGISAMPIAMDEVTILFEGIAPDADWALDVALAITRRLQPEEDARVTSQYRRELAHTLLQSALTSTLEKLDGICV
jgi:carbon-monoxide dehydrogenase medium subunit